MRKRILWCIAAVAAVLLLAFIWVLDIPHWQPLDLAKIRAIPQSTVVYDADGNELGSLYENQNREYTLLSSVPEIVRAAFVAAEDQRFYQHAGIDPQRMLGALWQDIKTLSFAQGASTITQQLVKLTHLTSEKTISRKAQEIVLALRLERKLSKDEILEAYLNAVYFGNGAYGIEAAAQSYFGKSASALTLGEGALLAGIIKAPSAYAPHLHPEAALARRNYVLGEMADTGAIDTDRAALAQAERLALNLKNTTVAQSWYIDQVLNEAQTVLALGTEEILSAGLNIYTAFDPELQDAAEALFAEGGNFPDPARDGTPCQASLTALDTQSGEIRALIGGRTYDVRRGLNRATGIRRSPGSAIKPVSTYAAALETGRYLPSSTVEDVRREFAGGYSPGNAGGKYYGTVSLRDALARSLNAATVELADTLGMRSVRETIAAFGLPLAPQDVNLALALGSMTTGVAPAELGAAYCAIANGGTRVTAHCVRRITDATGKLIYEAPTDKVRAVSAETAFLLSDMLQTAAASGSARALAKMGLPVAGKTGTVGEAGGGTRDIWTVAFTPELAVSVWMGFDEPDSVHVLPDSAGGSGHPAQLCAAFLSGVRSRLSGQAFSAPDTLVRAQIDLASLRQSRLLRLAAANTPTEYVQTEYFRPTSVPQNVSDLWGAPQAVTDLQLLSAEGETPVLAFTSLSANVDYLLVCDRAGERTLVAELNAEAGRVIVFTDEAAPPNEACTYAVIPRHRLLRENGVLLTGKESAAVAYSPGGLLNHLFGFSA